VTRIKINEKSILSIARDHAPFNFIAVRDYRPILVVRAYPGGNPIFLEGDCWSWAGVKTVGYREGLLSVKTIRNVRVDGIERVNLFAISHC
jgi:hypothetical protein